MNLLKKSEWNPYFAGALAGILAILSVWITGEFIGASSSFVRTAAMIEKMFIPNHVSKVEYFNKNQPKIDWQWMFVLGIMIGSFISAIISGTFKLQTVPDMWQDKFGKSVAKRAVFAFSGGFLAIIGARLAGGCPSGHGLSGLMQLAVSGFIALICFFTAGIISANLLYKGGINK